MLSWNVYMEAFNHKEIVIYDIFKGGHFEKVAKDIKNKTKSKEEFTEAFRLKLMSQFCCRSEYEVVITSWPTYMNCSDVNTAATQIAEYEYVNKHRLLRIDVPLCVQKKIDIYQQLQLNWSQFIDYVWNNI